MSDWIQSADGKETIREDTEAVIRRLSAENNRLRAALEACASDWISAPGTVMGAAQGLSAEFRRRMEIAHRALTGGHMTRIEEALIEAAEVIGYARDFVDGQIDVVDGDYGIPRPNRAMELAQRLDEAMSLIDAALNDPALSSATGGQQRDAS